jgi:hypothetical protein
MSIVLTPFSQPKGEQTIFHDLNFQQERYESVQQFVCWPYAILLISELIAFP